MLETIREFGLDQLDASREAKEAHERHTGYFVTMAEQANVESNRQEQTAWLDRLDAELDNLRSAMDWALHHQPRSALRIAAALHPLWDVRTHLSEGRHWLEQASARDQDAPATLRAAALNGIGNLAMTQGDLATAAARCEESLHLFRAEGDLAGVAATLGNLGSLAHRQGDIPRAERCQTEALQLWRQLGRREWVAGSSLNLGVAVGDRDPDRAEELWAESLTEFEAIGNSLGIAAASLNLGESALERGEHEQAARWYARALRPLQELKSPHYTAAGLSGLAVAVASRNAEPATRLFAAANALCETTGAALSPPEATLYEQGRTVALTQLGDAKFTTAWEAGRALSLDEAVAEALALADELAAEADGG